MNGTAAVDGSRAEGDPLLSVVVTIVEGGEALSTLLQALERQTDPPPMEVLVPVDASVGELLGLRERFPSVRFLDLGQVPTVRPVGTAAGQHELYDRRRSAALEVATGALVAILEDRGVPRPEWARNAVRLHRGPWAVIGGAIEADHSRIVDWALYVCDYSRYALPLPEGPALWVSDVNVTYKRSALEATRALWQDRFHEPAVHWELMRRGESMTLSAELVVDHHRTPHPVGRLLAERFHWGRLFGCIRAREHSIARRAVLVAMSPIIPVVVMVRHARIHWRRGDAWRFMIASPVILAFVCTWTVGEAVGTLTGRS